MFYVRLLGSGESEPDQDMEENLLGAAAAAREPDPEPSCSFDKSVHIFFFLSVFRIGSHFISASKKANK